MNSDSVSTESKNTIINTRKCTRCKREKDISYFEKKKYNSKLFKSCIDCKAKRICKHGNIKYYCIHCNTKCIHDKVKSYCRICNTSILCKHQILKTNCVRCTRNICKRHGNIRNKCKLCTDPTLCFAHSVEKTKCKPCNMVRLLAYNPFDPFSEYIIP